MISWIYENPRRSFYGWSRFKVMREKCCSYFDWFEEEVNKRTKEVIKSLKT